MRSKSRLLLNGKGFLGPIGDDLPSLIPLVFALVIFFTVFTQSFRAFDERNNSFKDAVNAVRLSDVFVGNSYITADGAGSKQFDQMCLTAQSTRTLNWKAGLIPLSIENLERKTSYFEGVDVQEIDRRFFVLDTGTVQKIFSCTNTDQALSYFSEGILVRFYPVALEVNLLDTEKKQFYVKPMLLVVIAWRA